jgi:hypothetical protein
MATTSPPLNIREPIAEKDGIIRRPFYEWLKTLRTEVDQAPRRQTAVIEETGQTAAIGTTAIPAGVLAAGYYRISTVVRVTTAAGASSSLTVSVSFISSGVSCTQTGTALTSNAVNAPQGETFVVKVDAPGPISYAVAYSSTPAGMAYELTVILERLAA